MKQNLHIEFFGGGVLSSINITDDSADPVRSAEDCPICNKELNLYKHYHFDQSLEADCLEKKVHLWGSWFFSRRGNPHRS